MGREPYPLTKQRCQGLLDIPTIRAEKPRTLIVKHPFKQKGSKTIHGCLPSPYYPNLVVIYHPKVPTDHTHRNRTPERLHLLRDPQSRRP